MSVENSQKFHFWLRDEVKPGEKRTAILPEHAAQLIQNGHRVTVEESTIRCVSNESFKEVGCTMAPKGTWMNSPKDTVILGLKELPETNDDLIHRHIFFAHCYKDQSGWKQILYRFINGGGSLWDLEFLTENGRRVAAFGRCAGYIGMAAGIIDWCHQYLYPEQKSLPPLVYHENFAALSKYVKDLLDQAVVIAKRDPKIIIIGAPGRCGIGATSLAESVGIKNIEKWDSSQTSVGGPFKEILEFDILCNAINLGDKIPPFLTEDMLKNSASTRKLSVIVDVSCDPNNPANPLPIYHDITTIKEPSLRIINSENGKLPVDIIAIDHLPSLVPYESSKEFADLLIPHLVQCGETDVWKRCGQLFIDKTKNLREEVEQHTA